MNEFIVWDEIGYMGEDDKVFFTLKELKDEGFHFHLDENGNTVIFELVDNDMSSSQSFLKHKTFTYIEKTDINNNKIYADCSIVELNYFSGSDWVSDYGYFFFDDENLRYSVHLINEREIVDFENSYFDCMKIIDTIQENKLELIEKA